MADPQGPPVIAVGRDIEGAPRYANPRDGAQFVSSDLAADGTRILEQHRPGLVILCAALSRVGDCEEQPELATRMNTELPGEVAGWCEANGARLLFVSTDLVFGETLPPQGGFTENDAPAPVSVYGESKEAGERAVMDRCKNSLVVRLPLLYGDSAGRGLGASDSLLNQVEGEGKPSLFTDEFRTPLEVRSAARALVDLGLMDVTGLLHVAGPDRTSRYALGLAILEGMGLSRTDAEAEVNGVLQASVPTVGARPADVCLNAKKAARLLEFSLPGLAEGIERALS